MSSTSLNELKEWLRIDGEDENNTLSSLLLVARANIKASTGITLDDIENNQHAEALYKMIEKIECSILYEDRLCEKVKNNLTSLYMKLESLVL